MATMANGRVSPGGISLSGSALGKKCIIIKKFIKLTPLNTKYLLTINIRPLLTVCNKNNFHICQYVVGTQKKGLNETVLLKIQNIC